MAGYENYDFELTVKKVNNGYVIRYYNGTLIAKSPKEVTKLITEILKEKE